MLRLVRRPRGLIPPLGALVVALFGVAASASAQTFTLGVGPSPIMYARATITSDPAGISCNYTGELNVGRSGTCSASFAAGTTVTLTVAPRDGGTFLDWLGDCSGTSPTCSVVVSQNRSATPRVDPQKFTVKVQSGGGNGTGTVRVDDLSNVPSVACPITVGLDQTQLCSGQFALGASVLLNVTPATNGSSVIKSLESPCPSNQFTGCTFSISGPVTITTTFQAPEINVYGEGTGSGRVVGGTQFDCVMTATNVTGTCARRSDQTIATPVTFAAMPDPGSVFVGWSGLCSGPGSCTTAGDYPPNTKLLARFDKALRTLTLTGAGAGGGLVRSGPAGINCTITAGVATDACTLSYADGATVDLTATPNAASTFGGWSGACTGTGTCPLTMNGDKSVVARFDVPTSYRVSVAGGQEFGHGTVKSEPAGIDCTIKNLGGGAGTCSADFPSGTNITLTATPIDGGTFNTWSGPFCASAGLTCTFQLTQNTGVLVLFAPQKVPITVVSGGGNGTGVVHLNDTQLACPVVRGVIQSPQFCTGQFAFEQPVLVVADVSNSGSTSTKSIVCSPAGTNGCGGLVVKGATTITVTYHAPAIVITGAGNGSGRVVGLGSPDCQITPGGVSGTCSRISDVTIASTRTLTAVPDGGSTFAGWSGLCSGTGACSTSGQFPPNDQLVARFETRAPVQNQLSVTGVGTGTVQSVPNGIACTITNGAASGPCDATFSPGTSVSLTATPAVGWTFSGWGGACSGVGTCQVSMTENRSASVSFTRTPVVLTLAGVGTGNGIVTSNPGGARCVITNGVVAATGCAVTLDQNTSLTLTADPQFGSTFGGWEGDACSGMQLTCSLTLAQARTATARFISPHSAHDVAMALLGGAALSADERAQLDRFGNKDGTFNLGDLLALLDRTGEKLTPATAAAVMALPQPPSSTGVPRRTP